MKVKITVANGVAYVYSVPPGVTVEVTDYDVNEWKSPFKDENGRPCSRYIVTAELIAAQSKKAA